MPTNTQVRLVSRPTGFPDASNFEIVRDAPLPELKDGEVLVRNQFLSLDPYMRGRMNEGRSYAPPVALGDVMVGGTAGEVVLSKTPAFAVGDKVVGALGWQEYGVANGGALTKVDGGLPLSVYLGVVGMPGVTAYIGLYDIGEPKEGETVVVSAAAGAVGSVVGQLAKIRGCRAVGIAGGRDKCDYVVRELGFDACIDHRSPDFTSELRAATRDGVDVSFENVGGPVMDAVLAQLNPFARVPLCGLVSQYNATEPYALKNVAALLWKRVKLQGFIVSDRMDRWPRALADLAKWVAEGKIRYRETVAHGLTNAPEAFFGMLRGANLGKQIVKLV
ncbi:MAG: NADP-dependent oxidoreductase [Labilithrix sp.]|nr:NADP-dependent oxidoreductase [Labilithrix sp.]